MDARPLYRTTERRVRHRLGSARGQSPAPACKSREWRKQSPVLLGRLRRRWRLALNTATNLTEGSVHFRTKEDCDASEEEACAEKTEENLGSPDGSRVQWRSAHDLEPRARGKNA